MIRSDSGRPPSRGAVWGIAAILLAAGLPQFIGRAADLQVKPRSLHPLVAALSAADSGGAPIKCGFVVLSQALGQRSGLSLETRTLLQGLMLRPLLQTSVASGIFRVHFDTSGINTPALLDASGMRIPGTARAYADSVTRILKEVADELETRHGFQLPPTDGTLGGGPEYDVYIEELSGEYGRTTPDVDIPDGTTVTSFIEIDNDFSFVYPDSNKGLPALRVTIAHEFHHAVQIGSYAYWQSEVYFHEMTSVWVEELLFTEVNDYYLYLRSSSGHFRAPHVPFTTSDLISYSRGIWGIYLEKRFGPGLMRAIWEECRETRPTQAIDVILRQPSRNSSMTAAFTEWALWNYWTGARSKGTAYYPEAPAYPEIVLVPTEFVPPTTAITQKLPPLSTRYHQVLVPTGTGRMDTVTLALNNVDYPSALSGTLLPISYTWRLASTPVDPSYRQTNAGIYVKLDVAEPLNWTAWIIEDSLANPGVSMASLEEGMAFPNPFTPDGSKFLYIPVDDPAPVSGSFSIYSGNMDRVYESGPVRSSGVTRQLFSWDGRTSSGQSAPTGIYIYVLSLDGGKTVRGKIAVLRK